MKGIGRARYLFVRTHPVKHTQEDIAEDQTIQGFYGKPGSDFEAGIFLQSA